MAQWVTNPIGNREVAGSIPIQFATTGPQQELPALFWSTGLQLVFYLLPGDS